MFLMRSLLRDYYGPQILYYFLSILTSSDETKTQNYKVVDLIEYYNFYINFIFIQRCIKEIFF